jgi:hypothetical protein
MSIGQSFCRSHFARFVNSSAGRIARVAAGCALIVWGYMSRADNTGIILMALGAAPVITGTLNLCLIGALLAPHSAGAPMSAGEADRDDSPLWNRRTRTASHRT